MAKQKGGLKIFFNEQFEKQRWLLLIFTADGLEIRRILYYPSTRSIREKSSIFFKNVSELTIGSSKFLKILPKILFFPFKYRISVIASRNVCRSKYFSLPFSRKHSKDLITKNEIAGIFSQYLWRCLEINKKEFAKANSYDDLSVLLVNNQVVNAVVDGKNFSSPDSIFGVAGKAVNLGIVQTFVYRPFFATLSKIFPKRSMFRDFHEYGFSLPLTVTLKHLQDSKSSNKKFIFAGVEDSETRIYSFNGTVLTFNDYFAFGSRSFYQALNHYMGVDFIAYNSLMKKISKNDIAPYAYKKLKEVLDKELMHLYNGLTSFKKSVKAGTVYVDGEKINDYLKTHGRFSKMLIGEGVCDQIARINLLNFNASHVIKADVGCMLGLIRNDEINVMAIKQIRWLLPQSMEVR